MCGRYRLSRRKQIIEEYFDCDPKDEGGSPRYNIAPTQSVPVIRQHPIRQLSLMKWGLIPSWAKDPSVAASTINARSETPARNPATAPRIGVAANWRRRWESAKTPCIGSGKKPV